MEAVSKKDSSAKERSLALAERSTRIVTISVTGLLTDSKAKEQLPTVLAPLTQVPGRTTTGMALER